MNNAQIDSFNIYPVTTEEIDKYIIGLSGYKEQREEIDLIAKLVFNNHDANKKYYDFLHINGNILLYGKPGTGKTTIAYECAQKNKKANFYCLNLSSLISEKLGKTSRGINYFFENVISESERYPVIVLIEEIEAFLPNRDSSKDLQDMKRALTTFMHYLDMSIPNLLLIATTNYKSHLDSAILRRFSFQFNIEELSKNDIIEFLQNEQNPFSSYFTDSNTVSQIADYAVEHKITISSIKNMMRKLLLRNNVNASCVNSSNLFSLMKEENSL